MVTDQLSAASRKQSLTSSELSQKTDGLSNQLISLSGSIARHTTESSQVADQVSGDDDKAGAVEERERLDDLLGEIDQLAGYLREDFDKLTGKRP